MPLRELFTEQELAIAFAFLLPPQAARSTAKRWFATIAPGAGVVRGGNYLAEESDWRRMPGSPPNVVVVSAAGRDVPTTGGYENLTGQSVEDRVEFLLHLSDFHLRLVMLISDEAFERITTFLGYDAVLAERARTQMKLIVQAMGVASV